MKKSRLKSKKLKCRLLPVCLVTQSYDLQLTSVKDTAERSK